MDISRLKPPIRSVSIAYSSTTEIAGDDLAILHRVLDLAGGDGPGGGRVGAQSDVGDRIWSGALDRIQLPHQFADPSS